MMQELSHSVYFTTGLPGSGKTYMRGVHFLVTEFLEYSKRTFVTNFPLDLAALSAYCAERGICTAEEVLRRVEVIPAEIVQRWRDGGPESKGLSALPADTVGPWDYFHGRRDLYISLDECHYLIHRKAGTAWESAWQRWVSVLRHNNNVLELVTQTPGQVNVTIKDLAGCRYELVMTDDEKDPFFGIQRRDWRNLQAGFSRYYRPSVRLFESQNQNDKWHRKDAGAFIFKPELFSLYNSYSGEVDGEGLTVAPLQPWQSMGRLALCGWFFWRHMPKIVSRFCVLIFLGWLLVGGGANYLAAGYFGGVGRIGKKRNSVSAQEKKPAKVGEYSSESGEENARMGAMVVDVPDQESVDINTDRGGQMRLEFIGSRSAGISGRLYRVGDAVKSVDGLYGDVLTGLIADDRYITFQLGGVVHVGQFWLPEIPRNPWAVR